MAHIRSTSISLDHHDATPPTFLVYPMNRLMIMIMVELVPVKLSDLHNSSAD